MSSEESGPAPYLRILGQYEYAVRCRSKIEAQLAQAQAVEKRLEARVYRMVDQLKVREEHRSKERLLHERMEQTL